MRFVRVVVCAVLVWLPSIHSTHADVQEEEILDGGSIEKARKNMSDGNLETMTIDHFRDCEDIQRASPSSLNSGVYHIQPLGYTTPFEAYCDFEIKGEGWTVIQRRLDGSVDFDRVWEDYKRGFGNLETEFWLGNEKISALTTQKRYQIRFELTGPEGPPEYAVYSYFRLLGESNFYKLVLGSYIAGEAGDSLKSHRGMYFTTKDADHDELTDGNCAQTYGRGGWWYRWCYRSNLNADYEMNEDGRAIKWDYHPGGDAPLKFVEMKLRAV